MSRADGILHLVLNAQPWDEIASGRKPVEYRDRANWEERIFPPGKVTWAGSRESAYHTVRLQRGFRKIDGVVPTMTFRIRMLDIGPADPRWTYGIIPEDATLVRIWLGDRIAPAVKPYTCEGCHAQKADGVPCGVGRGEAPPCGDGILKRSVGAAPGAARRVSLTPHGHSLAPNGNTTSAM